MARRSCGETYFMALRAASWDRQTNTPHPSEAEKNRKEKEKGFMLKRPNDQNGNGPA